MSSSPKPPKPVDPNVAAEAQARWARYGTSGPGGSTSWQGEGPNATQVTEWSPELQGLFGQMQGIAGQERQRYQAPEGFGSFRDRLMAQMNDRQSQGRPIYQPTQRFTGQLGQGGGSGTGGGGGYGDGAEWDGSGGPQNPMQIQAGQIAPGAPRMNKPSIGGMPGQMEKPAVMPGGPTDPGGKGLRADLAGMLGGQATPTPFRDAFLGPADASGQRHPIRNAMRGGLIGAGGRAIGNLMANAEQRRGTPTAGTGGAKPGPIPVGDDRQISPVDPVSNPWKKPQGRRRGLTGTSTRARTGASLGMGNQLWGAAQDQRALAAMGLHDYSGMEQ